MRFTRLTLPLALLLPVAAQAAVPVCGYRVERVLPHDPAMFTEGLFYKDGLFYESSGLPGASRIVVRRPGSTRALRDVKIDPRLFGEGIVDWNGELISLTWRNGVGYRWDLRTLVQIASFPLDGEGWGMTHDGRAIYQSDGSSALIVRDPASFAARTILPVTADGVPVAQLNELEWIDGQIWANVWMTDRIARIDPASGRVTHWVDLSGLRAQAADPRDSDDVLNGIAWDAATRRVFVTGKHWTRMFQIALKCPDARKPR